MNRQTLKESEARFQVLSEATFEGIVIHEKGRILDVNQAMVQMFGFQRSELLNKSIMDFLASEIHDITSPHLCAGDNSPYEVEAKRKDGSIFPVEIRVKSMPYQNRTVGVIAIRDITRHKPAKELLRKLEHAVETTEVGITISDNDGRIVYINPADAKMHGYTVNEVIGQYAAIFAPPEYRKDPLDQGEENQEFLYWKRERINVRKDGSTFPVRLISNPITDAQGHSIGKVTICEDMSAYKQAEELLLKLEHAVETTEVGITISDNDGRIVYINPADAKMHGYTVNEVIGQYAAIFAPPEYRKDPLDQGEENQEFLYWKRERINVRKDGSTFPVRLISNPITDAKGHSIGKVTICEDMSAYKEAENALKAEHNLLHTLIDHLPDLIYVKDTKSRYLLANGATVRSMAVATQDELLSKTDFDFHPLEMAEQYYVDEQAILDSGQPLINREEPVIDQQTGTIRWLLSTKVPFRDSQGNIAGLVGINRDITERKRMEAQLLTAHAELKEKNDELARINTSKDKFFSIISHDLRSPLNVVLGYSQLIDEDYESYSTDEIKLYVKDLRESAEKLYTLLENLLTWSRIQRGVMEYSPKDLNLRGLTEEALELFLSQAGQKQITLQSSVESEMYAYADYHMVYTVLRNLLSNALKFTPPGGLVEVAARRNGTNVEMAVSDTGVGIRKEDIPKLFRIDVRYTHVGTAGEEGTGLGLSLCKELIEKNGGTIWVESEVEQGTIFRFTLPKEPGKTSIFYS